MGNGIDHVSDTRSSKWAAEFGKLNDKYGGRDDSSMGRQPHSNFEHHGHHQQLMYSNKKPHKQLDRFEDDDQRSPERRPPKIIVDPATASPDRYNNDFQQSRGASLND